jgi:hypothetical protein
MVRENLGTSSSYPFKLHLTLYVNLPNHILSGLSYLQCAILTGLFYLPVV